jgi:hypothetical protein
MWSTLGGDIKEDRFKHPPFIFSQDGSALLLLLSVRDGDSGSYTHIGHLEVPNNQNPGSVVGVSIRPVTMGKFEVTRVVSWDEDNGYV